MSRVHPTKRPGTLPVDRTLVLDPPGLVPASRIVVRPVDHATPWVPLVVAGELDPVSTADARDTRRDVDVVRDQQRLARVELDDEALMPRALDVVRKNADDGGGAGDMKAALPLAVRGREDLVAVDSGLAGGTARHEQAGRKGQGDDLPDHLVGLRPQDAGKSTRR